MKKILIIFLAMSLFTACKNEKTSDKLKTENEKSDSVTKDTKSDNNKPKADELDEDGNSKADVESITGQDDSVESWPESEKKNFIESCINSAMVNGMKKTQAERYCDCTQQKIELLYPDINEAGNLTQKDLDSPAMKKLMKSCL